MLPNVIRRYLNDSHSSLTRLPHVAILRSFSATQRRGQRQNPQNDNFNTVQEESHLPRYLRRQLASERKPLLQTSSVKPTLNEKKVYRSKHYDASKVQASKSEVKLLEPHALSSRLKKLCAANQIDAAVSMLKNAPLDAQNTPVWNTLIWETMKAQRFKLGYQLYVDMKRRGHSPTTRTFQTMFKGLSRIDHWPNHTKQLANARSLYEAYQRHISSIKKVDSSSPELSIDPLAAYIKLLGDAGHYQDIFDVYYAMDTEGPLAPNQFIFTAIFQALAPKDGTLINQSTPHGKNAADAKLVWHQMLKASGRSPGFQIDSFLATSAIAALTHGGQSEHSLAFQIVRDYFGLCGPEESPRAGTIPLETPSIDVILRLCNRTRNYALCIHFVQQIKRRSDTMGGVSLLDRGHMEEVIKAQLAMIEDTHTKSYVGDQALATLEWMLRQDIMSRDQKIQPTLSTYGFVMTACWRAADWRAAMRTLELMTGYHSHDFMDGAIAKMPRTDRRSTGRNLIPTSEIVSSMIRTALASGDRANMRQCLRVIHHLGLEAIINSKASNAEESSRILKKGAFYTSKLTSAVIEIVERVKGGRDPQEEIKKWNELSDHASQIENRHEYADQSSLIPTKEHITRRNRVATL
ncbi:hypothetical protein AX17_000968 [Amanita inopinata Kibby_2008]|nr:hypothetical protein AX17_000968 [Amanita inopinata Kibby_2008]